MLKVLVPSIICLSLITSTATADVTYRKDIRPLWSPSARVPRCGVAYLGDFLESQDTYKKMMKARAWIPTRT